MLNTTCTVKSIRRKGEPSDWAMSGDSVEMGVAGLPDGVTRGDILCDPAHVAPVAQKLRGQVIVFAGLKIPITPGKILLF